MANNFSSGNFINNSKLDRIRPWEGGGEGYCRSRCTVQLGYK